VLLPTAEVKQERALGGLHREVGPGYGYREHQLPAHQAPPLVPRVGVAEQPGGDGHAGAVHRARLPRDDVLDDRPEGLEFGPRRTWRRKNVRRCVGQDCQVSVKASGLGRHPQTNVQAGIGLAKHVGLRACREALGELPEAPHVLLVGAFGREPGCRARRRGGEVDEVTQVVALVPAQLLGDLRLPHREPPAT
jgi:hypothetical protein